MRADSHQNEQYSSVLNGGITEAEALEGRLVEEKRRRRELEILLERKMIAIGLMTEEREKEKRRAVKAEILKVRAAFLAEQEEREKEIRADVRATLTLRFRAMRDEIVQKAAIERDEVKARCDRDHRDAMTELAARYRTALSEQTESITAQVKAHDQKKLDAHVQAHAQARPRPKKKRRLAPKPTTFASESDSELS
jgi:hypothetical protein